MPNDIKKGGPSNPHFVSSSALDLSRPLPKSQWVDERYPPNKVFAPLVEYVSKNQELFGELQAQANDALGAMSQEFPSIPIGPDVNPQRRLDELKKVLKLLLDKGHLSDLKSRDHDNAYAQQLLGLPTYIHVVQDTIRDTLRQSDNSILPNEEAIYKFKTLLESLGQVKKELMTAMDEAVARDAPTTGRGPS